MKRWRCSVDELAARRRQQGECERAQEALSRVTSCFQQLVTSLGSSADCSFLRDDMDEMRVLAHRICHGLSQRLVHLLSDCDPLGEEDRQVLERLWVLFLSALENFLSDLQKACDLIGRFPLNHNYDRRSLVNTGQCPLVHFLSAGRFVGLHLSRFLSVCPGCIDGMVGVAARVASVQVPWLTAEEKPSPGLVGHIAALEAMLTEMQLRVPVAFWAVEATQPAWAEVHGDVEEPDERLEDLMELDGVSGKTAVCFQLPCCGLGCRVEEGQ
ncbi:regulator of G-protein signaling 9-binding protein isoform X1 [Antennarius striatus]|uniref:regulator of G-protein signaling 9-binding protein isoform X1 n=1 Tax=Antennarius striatus TaxID=241820 RepID=UPI0035B2A983